MTRDLTDWEKRAALTLSRMEALHFLVGSWHGQGHDSGQPIMARTTGRLRLDGSWLELHEQLCDPGGDPLYEDFSIYRYDPVQEGLRVLHFMERSWYKEYAVRLEDSSLRWTTGPFGPLVRLTPTRAGWRSQVRLPDDPQPTVELSYQPATKRRA